MIKTSTKEKLPKGKSYPIGAEVISSHLEGVPQYNLLSITFWVQDQFFASEYNKKIKSKGKIVVVDADYSPTFDEWKIRINSIPSEFRSVVYEQLTEQALPELKRRLEDPKMQKERFWFKVAFSLETSEIEICR
jgi:hypothetical protein